VSRGAADGLLLRLAQPADIPRLETLIASSVRGLSVGYYSSALIESALRFMFGVDSQLIDDGTYYLLEGDAGPVACGGWSRRATLFGGDQHKSAVDPLLDPVVHPARIRAFYVHPEWAKRGLGRRLFDTCLAAARMAGFRELELVATLPGEPMYARVGFVRHERLEVHLPDGVMLLGVRMTRPITG
jgi:GNAT superfamily N-acetyltransferase